MSSNGLEFMKRDCAETESFNTVLIFRANMINESNKINQDNCYLIRKEITK
ncbi:hypothetical protein Sgly_1669 [Syntrophobotulus glycolicus DSM 8271]|uniref:Uncharacterized protein n=1 Tax=Syntrophobotulus glycolicus (strain DSM 8271 / FlGlyR) TaxID=645991 RepID=F0SYD2_SYNGF|nr:hypothetical protein Sgly_1669 [Syntrophobotulus glycolicus DSM 8271]